MHTALAWFAMPEVGLGAVFLISFLASSLLPLGSEPALLAFVAFSPEAVWAAIGVATFGNSIGGALTYWMGVGTRRVLRGAAHADLPATQIARAPEFRSRSTPVLMPPEPDRWSARAQLWTERFGAPILLLSWLPVVGDPLCAIAGWLRLPFWQCLFYIVLGKFARYAVICGMLLHFFA